MNQARRKLSVWPLLLFLLSGPFNHNFSRRSSIELSAKRRVLIFFWPWNGLNPKKLLLPTIMKYATCIFRKFYLFIYRIQLLDCMEVETIVSFMNICLHLCWVLIIFYYWLKGTWSIFQFELNADEFAAPFRQ